MSTPGLEAETPRAPAKTGTATWSGRFPAWRPGKTSNSASSTAAQRRRHGSTIVSPSPPRTGRRARRNPPSRSARKPPRRRRPPPSGLSVTVTGLHNAVTAGQYLTYFVRVKNSGSTPERQVVLTAAVPVAMAIDRLGTTGPSPTKPTYPDHTVTFTPLETLGPGETLTYRIRVQATRPGVFRFGVNVTSRGLGQADPRRRGHRGLAAAEEQGRRIGRRTKDQGRSGDARWISAELVVLPPSCLPPSACPPLTKLPFPSFLREVRIEAGVWWCALFFAWFQDSCGR